jgi:hypothetical protein
MASFEYRSTDIVQETGFLRKLLGHPPAVSRHAPFTADTEIPRMKFPTPLAGLCALLALPFAAAAGTAPTVDAVPTSAAVRLDPPADQASATDLAKKLQNPIGDLYSFPFQNNTNFNTGPHKGTQDILNVQPVIPIHLNKDWTVITRTILPLIWQPSMQPAQTVPFGTGPTSFSAFLSPANPTHGWLWGAGPIVQIPTISNRSLGSNVWGGGPTAVLVFMKGPWVAGTLANNVWSFGGTSTRDGTRYNTGLVQPFVNYNFGEGWYVYSAPIITANWLAAGNEAWTLPIGAGAGKIVKLMGKLPVNLSIGAYYNAMRPAYGASWQLRTQVTLIF